MATSKVGAKKSLFKKPAWASASTRTADDSDDDKPIFGQAHYSEILQAEKAKKERHAAKLRERAEKKRLEDEQRESKRRRISNEAEDSEYASDSDLRSTRSGSVASQKSHRSVTPIEEEGSRKSKSTPQKARGRLVDPPGSTRSPQTRSHKKQSSSTDDLIVLNDNSPHLSQDSEEEDLVIVSDRKISTPTRKSKRQELEPESEEEDEYLRQLKEKARQEARTKQTGARATKADTPGESTPRASTDPRSPLSADQASPSKKVDSQNTQSTSTLGDDDTEVQIWIKTIIPGAKEVIVNRKIGQPLDKVKDFWIKRNELPPSIAQKVFFTWNDTRLYNSTTMRSIIERLKKTHPKEDGRDPSEGKIMIEAVTDEIFQHRQKQRARRLADAEGGLTNNTTSTDGPNNQEENQTPTGEDGTAVSQPVQPSQKAGIVIKLKAQGLEEMNLRVRPNTTMAKILAGFCKLRKIDPSAQQTWLSYDGEKLAEDDTVEAVGFEHEDTVEVYLR